MRERQKILDLHTRAAATVLVTLVRVEGSSYRRPGARLLIASNGEYAGAISGGCLEAEVIRKAQWKTRNGAVLDHYSTLFDDTAEIPYGLGCGGRIDLLLEPANTPEFAALIKAMQAASTGATRRVITQLPENGATFRRCILSAEGAHLFHSATGRVDANLPFFDETLAPAQRLLVFGAGDDAQPLVHFAAQLGWRVTVIDSRPHLARPDRFPEADQVLHASTLDPQPFTLDPEDAIVLMTHSYEQDREWLTRALPANPRYLGLLGARHRSALLLAEAAGRLDWPLAQACEAVFAPMGLDLGGDGAEAIALATVAEIQACIEGKLPQTRRMTAPMIEEQLAQGGASRYLQAQCAL